MTYKFGFVVVMRMKKLTVQDINNYVGTTVNPLNSPDTIYELYSVPSFDSDYPEVLHGSEIGSSKVTIEENDVLVCKINPRINRVWIVKHHTKHQLIASSEWVIIRSPENNPRYLMYYFQSPTFRTYINSGLTGIGGSLTRAQPKQIAKYPVPLPSIELQDRIAATLDKLQSIITHRKQQLKKLDELVKARFVEMFGDTEDIRTIAEICSIITDGTHQPPKFVERGIPFLFVSNIVTNEITYNAEKFISEETYEELYKRTPIEIGDIVLSTVGSYGHPAIVKTDRKFLFQRHIAYLKPIPSEINSIYLHSAILSNDIQMQIKERVKGIAQKTLNLSEIRKITIPVAPMLLQEQFAAFVSQTDKSKVAVQKALDEAQLLFDSLMQEYFG